MRVGLLADRLDRRRTTGVGTYVAGLVKGLRELDAPDEFLLLADDGPRARRLRSAALGRPQTVRPRDLDLVHVLVPTMPVAVDVPLVVTVHDLMPLKFPRYFSRRSRWLYRWAMRQVRRHAAHVITDSEATAQDIVALLGVPSERVTVAHLGEPLDLKVPTPSGVDIVLRELGLGSRPYILFLGELSRRKNPVGLVDAFARIAPECAGLRLAFAGSPGVGSAHIRKRVREHDLEARVDFLGHVPRDAVPALLAGAAAVALPSEDEGFGIPAVEAMACGAPLVVSDRGALPEVVGAGALVVPYGDGDALATALCMASSDPDVRHRLAAAGRARAGAFSWRQLAETTQDVYRRTLGDI